MTSGRPSDLSVRRLPDWLAFAAVCVFGFLAAYRIELPGLYYDELAFVNAALGAPDNTFIHMRLGSLPFLIFPYMGALKAWGYAPIFRLFGVSALTIRLPAILLAAMTLLILYQLMRAKIGAVWATMAVWIMAVDPANVFPSRLDWGPTVLTHLFQAAILALWFSYRDEPKLWKPALIFICFGLGFFDRFNFIWLGSAFVVGICLCYPDSLKRLWISSPRFARWMAVIVILIALGAALYLILPLLLHFHHATGAHTGSLQMKWNGLLSTLSGQAVAGFIFGDATGIISYVPFWLIVVDGVLLLATLFMPMSNAEARENRKNGLFCSVTASLIFLQIVITPQAGGPQHYLMIFPLPFLAFAFLGKSLYTQLATKNLRYLGGLLFGSAAVSLFVVNVHNSAEYLFHFRNNPRYNHRWSPEIYSLSRYINNHAFEAKSIICVDWGLHTQLHALAPKELRQKMHDYWPVFIELGEKNQKEQTATLDYFFPEGKTLVLTFAASKESFPETRRNFLASVIAHPELKCQLVKEFWFAGEKIYELYEVVRLPHCVLQGTLRTGGVETGGGDFISTSDHYLADKNESQKWVSHLCPCTMRPMWRFQATVALTTNKTKPKYGSSSRSASTQGGPLVASQADGTRCDNTEMMCAKLLILIFARSKRDAQQDGLG
jgi:dolichyl-phosphate-mannose-protein mannosyltransferase